MVDAFGVWGFLMRFEYCTKTSLMWAWCPCLTDESIDFGKVSMEMEFSNSFESSSNNMQIGLRERNGLMKCAILRARFLFA